MSIQVTRRRLVMQVED
ncbi:hypothetical protein [Pseudomonas aeruginosa]